MDNKMFLLRLRTGTLLSLLIGFPAFAHDVGTAAAESLLSSPEDSGWSLEAIVATRKHATSVDKKDSTNAIEAGTSEKVSRLKAKYINSEISATNTKLRRTIGSLKVALENERVQEAKLRDELKQAQANQPDPSLVTLRESLASQSQEVDILRNQVSSLKAGLADREQKLKSLTKKVAIQSEHETPTNFSTEQNVISLLSARHEVETLKTELAKKNVALEAMKTQSLQQKATNEISMKNRDLTLASLQKENSNKDTTLKILQTELSVKNKTIADLSSALSTRGNELKQAAATLAALRENRRQNDEIIPKTDAGRRAYMAGEMMAQGLTKRLESWKQVGVSIDIAQFGTGLTDGLQRRVRLKSEQARKAQEAFAELVQNGAANAVSAAQKKMITIAKGRSAIKSAAGINWYRVRKGRQVSKGEPVSLSLIEQVAGGRIISRIPSLVVHQDDDIPSIVKDGMYLPGEGGEVVAYALARSIYGNLPLPQGVQPFTIMEYHLTGNTTLPATSKEMKVPVQR